MEKRSLMQPKASKARFQLAQANLPMTIKPGVKKFGEDNTPTINVQRLQTPKKGENG